MRAACPSCSRTSRTLRAAGRSETPEDGYSVPNYASDLSALLDHLGVGQAHILGSSAGGPIALRFALVAAVLVPFVKWPRRQWKPILAVSVTLGLIHFSLMFTGLRDLDASTAAISIQLQVPISSALAAMFLGDKLGWRRALGMVIAFAGVALIAGEPRLQGQYLAFALVLAATSMWAIANLQIKMMKDVDGLVLNAWVAGFGAPQLLAASLLLEEGQMAALAAADWRAAFSIFYQALFVVVIGYGGWYWLIKRYEVNQSMPFAGLGPGFRQAIASEHEVVDGRTHLLRAGLEGNAANPGAEAWKGDTANVIGDRLALERPLAEVTELDQQDHRPRR